MRRFLLLLLLFSSTTHAEPLKRVRPERVGMDSHLLLRADSAIEDAIGRGRIPGAVLAVVRHGRMAYLKAYGDRQVWPQRKPMTTDAIFDMASCSKAMSTAIATLILCERGQLRLLDPVSLYIPGFEDWIASDGESTPIRIEHLLTHTSGLPAYISPPADGRPDPDGLIQRISHIKRKFAPATDFCYSCLNFITLQRIVETVSGHSLRQFARENIFAPLGMGHTDYIPCAPNAEGVWQNTDRPCWARDGENWREQLAPTAKAGPDSVLCGIVHDPLARIMNGGISGNAGLFSTAEDVAILCAMLQNEGQWNGHRIMTPATVRLLRSVPRFAQPFGRTMGWDSQSAYASCNGDLFSPETYSHTGFTGTSIVIDPVADCSVILLVNAVHLENSSGMVRLRSIVSNLVAASIKE